MHVKLRAIFATMILVAATFFTQVSCADENRVGVEIDLLPFVLDGYYAGVSVPSHDWRYRFVVSKVELPSFVRQAEFDRHAQLAVAILLDYYYEHQVSGWWTGIGFEYWHNLIREASTQQNKTFAQGVVTLGQGYVWRLHENIYLNPWAAFHVPLDSEKVRVGNTDYNPLPVLAEASLKIGFLF